MVQVHGGQHANTASGVRRRAFITGAAQAVMGGVLWHFGARSAAPGFVSAGTVAACVLWALASAFLLTASFAPRAVGRLYQAWTTFARAIGVVLTVVMFTVLFVVFLPLFLFVRLRDPLRKRLGGASYWEACASDDHSLDRALRPY